MIKTILFLLFSIGMVHMLPVSELAGMHQLDEAMFDESGNNNNTNHNYNLTICKNQKDGQLISDHNDRTLFYECTENVAHPFHCPTGLVFDQTVGICIVDHNQSIQQQQQQPPIDDSISSTFDCNGKENGFYADDNDQQRFHQCSNGKASDLECPTSTVFDLKHKACTLWPKDNNVQRPARDTTNESTLTASMTTPAVAATTEQSLTQRNRRSGDQQPEQQEQQQQHHQLEDVAKEKHIDLHVIETTTTTNFDVWID